MKMRIVMSGVLLAALFVTGPATAQPVAERSGPDLRLLFLGDRGHHQPAQRFAQLYPVLRERRINLVYTEDVNELQAERLNQFHGLILYANIDELAPRHAQALLAYVAAGHAFVPLHCASYCFRNQDAVVDLIGAQFQRHGTGVFRVRPSDEARTHPVMQQYDGFESWDETYVHTRHNPKDRIVLEYRDEGGRPEPWTWVRTHGQGRVFYTAWGHDERTWSHPGFQNLIERGIRWACGDNVARTPPYSDRPALTSLPADAPPFQYVEADVPFYPPGQRWGTVDTGKRRMQLPVSPSESLQHMVTPAGFRVELFASEPMLGGKPLTMSWDERGRLWVCESIDYPNELHSPGAGRDRIRILEDSDGDGRADTSTVFAERLSIPTAITFYRSGAIVQDGRETVYLRDQDGDGRADLRKVLITGWALGDTHGGVSNFQYGLDNWFYAMQGYNASEPVYDDGRRKAVGFRMGFFRFRMEGEGEQAVVKDLEFLRSTNNNTWGLGISEAGLIFGSTANNNPSEFLPIPNRYYEAVRGWSSSVLTGIADSNQFEPLDPSRVRQVDQHGGFTAAAGHALYTARRYPREYWNRTAFVTEPTGHLIATFVLRPDGAGFRSKNSWNLLASNDEWTAPIMAEVGPDGNVWFIDWYNYIVQHNPTPAGYKTGRGNAYESELRDKKHGRIYRVVWTGPDAAADPRVSPYQLDRANPAELVRLLSSDNFFWRRQAQRLLVEQQATGAVDSLIELAGDSSIDAVGLNPGVIHALWTLAGLRQLESPLPAVRDVVRRNLKHGSAAVRRNAVLVLPRDEAVTDVARMAAEDSDPQVRLAACLACAEMASSPEAARWLLAALRRPDNVGDRWLRDGLTAAAARHDREFLVQLAEWQADTATQAGAREIVRRVAEHYARGGPAETVIPVLQSLVSIASSPLATEVVAGLVAGWPRDRTPAVDAPLENVLGQLLAGSPPTLRAQLVTLGSRWGSQKLAAFAAEISAEFLTRVRDESASEADRIQAAEQLMELQGLDSDAASALLDLVSPRIGPALAEGLIGAVARSRATGVGMQFADRLAQWTPQARAAGIRTLLGRAEWSTALVEALASGKVPVGDLTLDQKLALSSHPNRELARRVRGLLERGGGLPSPDRQKVIDELLSVTDHPGDAQAGKAVFLKTCAKCHTHSGEGTRIGPDLTGMAVHPKHELLIHIMDPSRSVEGNFRIYSVLTGDGRVVNGLLASETRTAIELVDAEAKRHTILREDIDELVASTKSLMPEGFEKQHTPREIGDLLEFLTQRGKYLPLPLDKVATVVSTKGMFNSESAAVERLVFADWSPKTVDGIPFVLVDPQGDRMPNVVMLQGEHGTIPRRMPRSVQLPCHAPARAIHFLSGISGWGYPAEPKGTHSMTVRLTYKDGQVEDHLLLNGEHFADYIRRVDVPGSKFAFALRNQQVRFFSILPQRREPIATIDLIKGKDPTVPVVMAVTLEAP